jgi:hypothetical protein
MFITYLGPAAMTEQNSNIVIPAKALEVTLHLIDDVTCEILLHAENRLPRFEALQVSDSEMQNRIRLV